MTKIINIISVVAMLGVVGFGLFVFLPLPYGLMKSGLNIFTLFGPNCSVYSTISNISLTLLSFGIILFLYRLISR